MDFAPKKKKYPKKIIVGTIIAKKVYGLENNKVVFYVLSDKRKMRFINIFKDKEQAQNYYQKYKIGSIVCVTYLDTFFPLILKMEDV